MLIFGHIIENIEGWIGDVSWCGESQGLGGRSNIQSMRYYTFLLCVLSEEYINMYLIDKLKIRHSQRRRFNFCLLMLSSFTCKFSIGDAETPSLEFL